MLKKQPNNQNRFNTQPPEGGCAPGLRPGATLYGVSTHSRPKAAANGRSDESMAGIGFNTQPPEGGCSAKPAALHQTRCFNTQPPEGGCKPKRGNRNRTSCFNTQPPEGGCLTRVAPGYWVHKFQHTAARRRLHTSQRPGSWRYVFQHTAARRRLLGFSDKPERWVVVSTHSRPKAAAGLDRLCKRALRGFNTQPPEGGCAASVIELESEPLFQHTAARRRLRFAPRRCR